MRSLRFITVTASLLAIGACGTHNSVAPVSDGAGASSNARVYNSPQETAAANSRLGALYEAPTPARARPAGEVEPVTLKPVSSVYLSETGRATVEQANFQTAQTGNYGARTGAGRIIAVAKGDTVYALGRRHNVDPKAIIAVNNLRAPYRLEIGQQLRLPGAVTGAGTQAPAGRTTTATPTAAAATNADTRYRVKRGDTLYAVSRATGVSVAALAQANGLVPPYTLSPGQELRAPKTQTGAVSPRVAAAPVQTVSEPSPAAPQATTSSPAASLNVAEIAKQASFTKPDDPDALFAWPVRGAVIAEYGIGDLGKRNDGINIAAPLGTPVRASADGEVVYRGSELEGFGNLLLVKHPDGFVTAYAHNDAMLVKKGDVVRKGQVIAKVGSTGSVATPQLHFEIRQKLKSVDPLSLLIK